MKHERTLQEAARIYARLQATDCTQADKDAAQAWQEEDPEHRKAFELADRISCGVGALAVDERMNQRLRALTEEGLASPALAPPSRSPRRTARSLRRRRIAAGLAATVVVALIAAWQVSPSVVTGAVQSIAYDSLPREVRVVTLEDGSTVRLDVNTRLAVRMSSQRRHIELLSGRALFEVTHDSTRPFSVSAAGSRTTALGTKFQVQRDDTKVIVTLTEGSVAVDRDGQNPMNATWHERLIPGEQLSIETITQQRQRQHVDAHVITSWAQGRHIFRGTSLRDAIDEVNRYADKKVRLGDASLASLPVAGNFIVGDSDVVVDAFAAVLPLRVVDAGDQGIILFRNDGERQ